MDNTSTDSPLPHRMIRITLYATRLSDLRRQIEELRQLNFHTRGNMEITTGTARDRGFSYTYIQHMTRKP